MLQLISTQRNITSYLFTVNRTVNFVIFRFGIQGSGLKYNAHALWKNWTNVNNWVCSYTPINSVLIYDCIPEVGSVLKLSKTIWKVLVMKHSLSLLHLLLLYHIHLSLTSSHLWYALCVDASIVFCFTLCNVCWYLLLLLSFCLLHHDRVTIIMHYDGNVAVSCGPIHHLSHLLLPQSHTILCTAQWESYHTQLVRNGIFETVQ